MAVGDYRRRAAGSVLVLRWNGTRWAILSAPGPRRGVQTDELLGVDCWAATGCEAVGHTVSAKGDTALAEQRNGHRWIIQPTPVPRSPDHRAVIETVLYSVSCRSARDCTAVGSYRVTGNTLYAVSEHWDGRRWVIRPVPRPPDVTYDQLFGIQCPSATDCVAVGVVSRGAPSGDALVERWNGHRWASQPTPAVPVTVDAELHAVVCQSASDCVAVGGYANGAGGFLPLTERWNGVRWALVPVTVPTGRGGYLYGVSCVSRTDCTAAGGVMARRRVATFGPLAERWNGTRWRIEPAPAPSSSNPDQRYGFQSVSCPAGACMAVALAVTGDGKSLSELRR